VVNVDIHYLLHPHLHGWRWSVSYSDDPCDWDRIINAGMGTDETSRKSADIDGQRVLYSVMNALGILGIEANVIATELDHDPIPAGPVEAIDTDAGVVIRPAVGLR
jgi:hypothetical protein